MLCSWAVHAARVCVLATLCGSPGALSVCRQERLNDSTLIGAGHSRENRSRMRGMTLGRTLLLGVALASAACGASAKKLWGLDVGNKEEKGEFESLLQRAARQDSAGAGEVDDDIGQALKALADLDLSDLSLSDLCTSAIDAVLGIVKDEEWLAQYAEPGVLGGLVENSGFAALMGEQGTGSVEEQDLADLLALEGSPILYKTKFFELVEKVVSNLKQLRTDLSDPSKVKAMLRDTLKIGGFEREQIDQVMEIVDHPEMLAAQIKALLNDPMVIQELTKAFDSFSNAASMLEDVDLDGEELSQLLEAMEADPAMMEEMYAELMKDPAFSETMKSEGGGSFFNAMGGGRTEGAGAQQQQRVEL